MAACEAADLQAQLEAILVESVRNAASRCVLLCMARVEEERRLCAKMCSEQVLRGPVVVGSTPAMSAPLESGESNCSSQGWTKGFYDNKLQQWTPPDEAELQFQKVESMDADAILRKVATIQRCISSLESETTPATKESPRGPKEAAAKDPDTDNIFRVLKRVKDYGMRRVSQVTGIDNEEKAQWSKTLAEVKVAESIVPPPLPMSPPQETQRPVTQQVDVISLKEAQRPVTQPVSVSSLKAPSLDLPSVSKPMNTSEFPLAYSFPTSPGSVEAFFPKNDAASLSTSRSLEAAKVYAARNAELGRCLAEITADLQRACIISSSCKSTLRTGSASPLLGSGEAFSSSPASPFQRSFPSSPMRLFHLAPRVRSSEVFLQAQ